MLETKSIPKLAEQLLAEIWSHKGLKELTTEMRFLIDFLDYANIEKIIVDISKTENSKRQEITEIMTEFNTNNVVLLNFINYLLTKNLFDLFNANNFKLLFNEIKVASKKMKTIKLTLALELKQEDILNVKALIEKKFSEKFLLQIKLKPNLIAGYILEKDAQIIDASVETMLEDYRKEWVNKLNVSS